MWLNSSNEHLFQILSTPKSNGRKIQDGAYSFDWECPKAQKEIKETIGFLTKGCSCKLVANLIGVGVKKGNHCGPGCNCQSCKNVPIYGIPDMSEQMSCDSDSEDDASSSVSSDNSDDEDSNIMAYSLDEYVIDMLLYIESKIAVYDIAISFRRWIDIFIRVCTCSKPRILSIIARQLGSDGSDPKEAIDLKTQHEGHF